MQRLLLALLMLVPAALTAQDNPNYDPDYDGDGCYSVADILGLLPLFGSCVEITPAFACGDSILFDSYWYETVLISDQCWFAENLRTTVYANDESIQESEVDSLWHCDEFGAEIIYGEGEIFISPGSNGVFFTPGDTASSLSLGYGRLYNFQAVSDPRGLCPVGWMVSSMADWDSLVAFVTNTGVPYPLETGNALKSDNGWAIEPGLPESGNGADSFGFNAKPAGYIERWPSPQPHWPPNEPITYFDQGGEVAIWWAPTADTTDARGMTFCTHANGYYGSISATQAWPQDDSAPNWQWYGFSVRCIRDAE